MKAGAEAVKLEGTYTEAISAIVRAGIPVMGHVGLTPQSFHQIGGYRVQGKGDQGEVVLDQAMQIEKAGAFGIVLELIPAVLAAKITENLRIPTIGIGAGVDCSGEVQVWHDLIGLSPSLMKHSKRYVSGRDLIIEALSHYREDVKSGKFPAEENSF